MTNLTTILHDDVAVEVTGVLIDSFTEASLTQRVIDFAKSPGVDIAVGVNAHVCNLARKDVDFARFLDRSYTYADGQSVVWGARLLGSGLPMRLATTDIATPILHAAAKEDIPVYFFGAAEGVAETAAEKLRAQIPGLKLRTHHGYVKKTELDAVFTDIREHGTKILFVGMGDPIQEQWVEEHIDEMPPAVLTCGGLFDWLSGSNRRAPGWMIRAGCEWLWRLMIEPKRLARRYIVGNPTFMYALAVQRLRLRA